MWSIWHYLGVQNKITGAASALNALAGLAVLAMVALTSTAPVSGRATPAPAPVAAAAANAEQSACPVRPGWPEMV